MGCERAGRPVLKAPLHSLNGKKSAVVLTYDDAIPQQLLNAVPVLDSLGIKATFYLTALTVKGHIRDWKRVATGGHE